MSQENVEIVRAGFEAWNAGDMDAYGELLDPDVIIRVPEGWPEPGRSSDARPSCASSNRLVMPGPSSRPRTKAASSPRERFLETFEEVRIELEDILEVDEGVVIAENLAHIRGRGGIETTARSAWLITLRNGQQTSLTLYQSKAEALEAVGLSE